jgi:hypothetical protein
MKKKTFILSAILNGLVIVTEIFALLDAYLGFYPAGSQKMGLVDYFDHYTNLSNILLLVAAIITLVASVVAYKNKKEAPLWVTAINFIATVSVLTTFIVVMTLLLPQTGVSILAWPTFLFLHAIDPVLAFLAFAFIEVTPELKKKQAWLCLIPLVLYAGVVAPLASLGKIDDPYAMIHLLDVTSAPALEITWKWCAIFFGTFVVGFLLLWLRQAMAHLLVKPEAEAPKEDNSWKEEKKEEPAPAQEDRGPQATPSHEVAADDVVVVQDEEGSEEAEEAEEAKEEEEEKKTNPTGYMNRPRVYHIAKQDTTGKWQVRLATGQKAIKLFDTQEEAINYAKGLVKSQGGSIRVHSLKGKTRKE